MPEVVVIDACQRQGRGGSPTAVLDEASFTDEERCRMPGELGTSHAVFIRATGVERGRPSYSLRFFTAEGELPACGHGTVAALALLAIREGGSDHHAVLCTTSRSFEGWAIRNRDSVVRPGPVNLRVAQAPELRAVTAGLGVADEAVVGNACPASNERPRLLLPVRSRAALADLSPDFALLRAACDRYGLLGCYAYSIPDRHGRAAARMFAPSIGIPEDIANANSTTCLAAHLLDTTGAQTVAIEVEQGDTLGRPASVLASARRGPAGITTRVGGGAVVRDGH
ncbi:PhzF family phenazine biosynthesis protein [Streptomyces sp. A1136]|uniref:PhzF family phenazine biosynthesis protein n=1 Tax=Streptomyces sp. A1136 TaxID=2563102 RepID=UPI00109EB802|nr:PhzF family phenazine biosynthesis isomerase [Streptomyces sp. A1136]THA44502.1 PhzF family phenazine biosynthesis protein [Streptomyces sp. A1136]